MDVKTGKDTGILVGNDLDEEFFFVTPNFGRIGERFIVDLVQGVVGVSDHQWVKMTLKPCFFTHSMI